MQSPWIPPSKALEYQIEAEKVVVKWLFILNDFAVNPHDLDGASDPDFPFNGHLVALFSSIVR
jgi:hypothetical protein